MDYKRHNYINIRNDEKINIAINSINNLETENSLIYAPAVLKLITDIKNKCNTNESLVIAKDLENVLNIKRNTLGLNVHNLDIRSDRSAILDLIFILEQELYKLIELEIYDV